MSPEVTSFSLVRFRFTWATGDVPVGQRWGEPHQQREAAGEHEEGFGGAGLQGHRIKGIVISSRIIQVWELIWGVPSTRGTPIAGCFIYIYIDNSIRMDDLGVPPFMETRF